MFGVIDALIAGGLLWSARLPLLALATAALAAGLLAAHTLSTTEATRLACIGGLLVALFLLPQAALIASRPQHAPIQDGLLLTEAAARRLLGGLDPYGHDYVDDPWLRSFYLPEFAVNPLLGHFVYPPGPLLLALPFAAAGIAFAWFWLPALGLLAAGAWLAAGRAGVVAVALSPLLLLDYLLLFNDLFFVAFGLAAVGLLARRRPLAAGLALAAALALKQTAVVLVPPAALLAGLFLDRAQRVRFASAAAALLTLLAAPFLAWSAAGFLGDTAAYFYGSGIDSFPIRGPGLPGLLLGAGVLPSRWSAFPAGAFQVVALTPLLYLAGRDLRARFSWPRFWGWAGLETVAVFFFGRTLAPNYVTVAGLLLSLAIASAAARDPHNFAGS